MSRLRRVRAFFVFSPLTDHALGNLFAGQNEHDSSNMVHRLRIILLGLKPTLSTSKQWMVRKVSGLSTGRPPSVRVVSLLLELETLILRRLDRLRFCSTKRRRREFLSFFSYDRPSAGHKRIIIIIIINNNNNNNNK